MYEKLSYQIKDTLAVFCCNYKITKLVIKKIELMLVKVSNAQIKKMHHFEFI